MLWTRTSFLKWKLENDNKWSYCAYFQINKKISFENMVSSEAQWCLDIFGLKRYKTVDLLWLIYGPAWTYEKFGGSLA